MQDALKQFVIYDRPRDFPTCVVVRQWNILPTGATPSDRAYLFYKLDKARAWCAQQGLVCLARHPSDDPCIVETWT